MFDYYYERRNKQLQIKPGIITIIHTFGRDLKFNPHIHVLVTEGGMDSSNDWKPLTFISYEYLQKSWQKIVMDSMKRWFPNNTAVQKLINDLYRRYTKVFLCEC
ncbi:transposase [Solibacillus sp. FSL H8-0538]|uniref:transposase n=1 Tax=Solibacillus sp. FSL H8-0538 TaxID=2921400 RepID=UPI0030F69243